MCYQPRKMSGRFQWRTNQTNDEGKGGFTPNGGSQSTFGSQKGRISKGISCVRRGPKGDPTTDHSGIGVLTREWFIVEYQTLLDDLFVLRDLRLMEFGRRTRRWMIVTYWPLQRIGEVRSQRSRNLTSLIIDRVFYRHSYISLLGTLTVMKQTSHHSWVIYKRDWLLLR